MAVYSMYSIMSIYNDKGLICCLCNIPKTREIEYLALLACGGARSST